VHERDGWTVRTADTNRQHILSIRLPLEKNKADVLSTFDCIEEALKENNNIKSHQLKKWQNKRA